jgi:hypothetical protein
VALNRKRREMRGQNGSSEDETEDMIEVDEGAPQPRRTKISAHLKDRVMATKIRTLSAKRGERQTTTGAIPSQWATENATTAGNA